MKPLPIVIVTILIIIVGFGVSFWFFGSAANMGREDGAPNTPPHAIQQ